METSFEIYNGDDEEGNETYRSITIKNNEIILDPNEIVTVQIIEIIVKASSNFKEIQKIKITNVSNKYDPDIDLPNEIGELPNLTILDLRNDKIKSIPESIGQLPNLTILELGDNNITSLPESIGNLSQLTRLDLENNKLRALPESIGNLSQLTFLHLNNNKITALPESIGNLSHLENLNLMNNKLTSLPDSIGNLSQLTRLDLDNFTNDNRLYPERNNIRTLPESIGNLLSLKYFTLHDMVIFTPIRKSYVFTSKYVYDYFLSHNFDLERYKQMRIENIEQECRDENFKQRSDFAVFTNSFRDFHKKNSENKTNSEISTRSMPRSMPRTTLGLPSFFTTKRLNRHTASFLGEVCETTAQKIMNISHVSEIIKLQTNGGIRSKKRRSKKRLTKRNKYKRH